MIKELMMNEDFALWIWHLYSYVGILGLGFGLRLGLEFVIELFDSIVSAIFIYNGQCSDSVLLSIWI